MTFLKLKELVLNYGKLGTEKSCATIVTLLARERHQDPHNGHYRYGVVQSRHDHRLNLQVRRTRAPRSRSTAESRVLILIPIFDVSQQKITVNLAANVTKVALMFPISLEEGLHYAEAKNGSPFTLRSWRITRLRHYSMDSISRVLQTVFTAFREAGVDFVSLKSEDFSSLIARLGDQKDYGELKLVTSDCTHIGELPVEAHVSASSTTCEYHAEALTSTLSPSPTSSRRYSCARVGPLTQRASMPEVLRDLGEHQLLSGSDTTDLHLDKWSVADAKKDRELTYAGPTAWNLGVEKKDPARRDLIFLARECWDWFVRTAEQLVA
ncbi:hypothetical protein AAE478_006541 [Parahypoxylon ruwenzoriense]